MVNIAKRPYMRNCLKAHDHLESVKFLELRFLGLPRAVMLWLPVHTGNGSAAAKRIRAFSTVKWLGPSAWGVSLPTASRSILSNSLAEPRSGNRSQRVADDVALVTFEARCHLSLVWLPRRCIEGTQCDKEGTKSGGEESPILREYNRSYIHSTFC